MYTGNRAPRLSELTALMLALLIASAFPMAGQVGPAPSVAADSSGRGTLDAAVLQSEAQAIIASVGGDWSVAAWSISGQRRLFSIDAGKALVPASNNKVFTSIWALDRLGPDHRFTTDLLLDGPVEGGVLRGDVVLRGSGDPAFGYPPRAGQSMFVEDPMTPLRRMAARLREIGITTIDGAVVGDPTAFDSALVGRNWPNDTGGGAAQYAPGVSGLAFQRNMVWVEAIGSPTPGPAAVQLSPPVLVIPLDARVQTGAGRSVATRRPGQDTIRVSGAVPPRQTIRYGVGVSNPALMAADALRAALAEQGITVRQPTRVAATPEGARIVHRHFSIPVGTMIPFLNRDSDNFFAEHLWQASVRATIGAGSFDRGGPASALHFIERVRIPAGEIYQFDGSGLSNLNRASANALVRALVYAHHRPYSDAFHRSLAVAGDPAGSMSRMFRNTPAAGVLRAKTGFISRARTLSGYVQIPGGELIAFSFLYNGPNTNGARAAQERLGVLLAEYARGRSASSAPLR